MYTDTRFEVYFNITLSSTVTFRYGLDNGRVLFDMLGLENIDTNKRYSPNKVHPFDGYYGEHEYDLSAGSYTITVLAKVHNPYNEAIFSCYIRDETSPPGTAVNHIRTRTYTSEDGADHMDRFQYFDGLGRPEQTVWKGITRTGKDLVALQEYDALGRESNRWLPAAVPGNNGGYVPHATVKAQAIATNANDHTPYSFPVYETSPLDRIQKQFGPGSDWQANGKAVVTGYKTNVAGDAALNCKLYLAGGSPQSPVLSQNGDYDTGQLYVTEGSEHSNPVVKWFQNRSWGGDSAGDQRAIKRGMRDSGSYWKHKWESFNK